VKPGGTGDLDRRSCHGTAVGSPQKPFDSASGQLSQCDAR